MVPEARRISMKAGIYKIEHIDSGRLYIGSSKRFKDRLTNHKRWLKRKEHFNSSLQNAVNKYGIEKFIFEVILICRPEDLIFYEQKAMDTYKSYKKEFGYNQRPIAESNRNMPFGTIHKKGQKYSMFTLIERVGTSMPAVWLCRCDCGKEVKTHISNMRHGATKSCGCYNKKCMKDLKTTHNKSTTPEYGIWSKIRQRCYNTNSDKYRFFGGIGIKVCDSWKFSFENFYKDLGKRPEGTMLCRKDTSKDFSPENCEWSKIKKFNNLKKNLIQKAAH